MPQPEKKVNKWLIAIPAFFDQAEMCLKLIATVMISSSVVQMLSSSNLIFTAILTVCFLKKRYYIHHYSSILVIVAGIVLVGMSYMLNDDGNATHSASEVLFGLILLQVGQVIGATAYIVEEKLLGD